MTSEPEPEGLVSTPLANSHDWQRRLLYTILGCLVLSGFVVLVAMLPELTRPPHLVYPPSVQATLEAQADFSLYYSGERPFNDELMSTLVKAYGLDGCEVGGKYGALCQDGTLERTQLLREDQLDEVCSKHGGVEEWIECR